MTAPTSTRAPLPLEPSRLESLERRLGESAFRISLTRDLLDELAQQRRALPPRPA